MPDVTFDTFFNGRLSVCQEENGYRFSIDAVILAYFAGRVSGKRILDLGTGCGIIPMILSYRDPEKKIFGIEIQTALAKLAERNVEKNRMTDKISILNVDLRGIHPDGIGGWVDVVVVNPPFYKADTGRINPNMQRAVARHELKATLRDIVTVAARMLRMGGIFLSVYSSDRLCDMITELRTAKIEPKKLRLIHSTPQHPASLILVEGIKGGRPGIKIPPPLVIYDTDGQYTPTVSLMFQHEQHRVAADVENTD